MCPNEFSRSYVNKLQVYDVGDLFVQPPSGVPCVNVSTMAAVATSISRLATENVEHTDRSYVGSNPSSFNLQLSKHFVNDDLDEQEEDEMDPNRSSVSVGSDFHYSFDAVDNVSPMENYAEQLEEGECTQPLLFNCGTIDE